MDTNAFMMESGREAGSGTSDNGFCIIRLELDAGGKPADGVFLHVNEALARMEGKPVEAFTGHRYFELFPDRSRDRLQPHFEAASLGKTVSFDDVSEEIDRFVHIDVYPTGEPGCCACVLRSIMEEVSAKMMEQQKLENLVGQLEDEQRLNARIREFATTMGMVYPLAISMDYLHDSYQMLECDSLFNKDAPDAGNIDEMIRIGASSIPDSEASELFWTRFNRTAVIESFRQGRRQIFLRHPQIGNDGRTHSMYTMVVCTEISETQIRGMAISRCIDDEMERDIAVSNATRHLEVINALSTLYTTIMEADLRTHEYRVVRSVPLMKEALDGKLIGNFDLVLDNIIRSFMHPEMHDGMRAFLRLETLSARLENTDTVSTEYMDNSDRWFVSRFIVLERDADGHAVSALYAARDITVEKQKELRYLEQLEAAAAEADRANLSKTNFLRRMSHDIRTPLNGIIGMLKIMDSHEGNPIKYRDYMNKITRSADYLLSIVNNVLDISRMETGNIELEHRPFDLMDLLLNILPLVATNASQNSVIFTGSNEDLHIRHRYVVGSPVHLNRILMNVASNAIKYNRSGGNLKIYCNELECDGEQAVYEFVCEDTGVGMSEEFQKRAFEPFTQEGKSSTTGFSGSGLGLSIVQKIVAQMGGSIELQSEENVGTTIRIVLTMPLGKNIEQNGNENEAADTIDLSGHRALLVEDNEINMEIASVLLKGMGLAITCAWNGQEAVDIFQNAEPHTFDVIFMDMMMPVMDGLEATRTIRSMPRPDAASVPIIAMTANAFAEDRQMCLEAGMNEHIGKPVDSREVVRILYKFVK